MPFGCALRLCARQVGGRPAAHSNPAASVWEGPAVPRLDCTNEILKLKSAEAEKTAWRGEPQASPGRGTAGVDRTAGVLARYLVVAHGTIRVWPCTHSTPLAHDLSKRHGAPAVRLKRGSCTPSSRCFLLYSKLAPAGVQPGKRALQGGWKFGSWCGAMWGSWCGVTQREARTFQ